MGEKKTKIMLYSTQLKLKLKLELSLHVIEGHLTTSRGGRVGEKKTK